MTKILIVDSADGLRRNLASQLAHAGYEPAVAASGAEALAHARTSAPDLVLLDVSPPDMDGFELLRVLRRELGDAPLIIVTARSRELDEIIALDLGADDYLTKPVDAGFNVATAVRFGDPATEIERYIAEQKVDLVAMTTHGRTGLARVLMGSVAQHVVNHAQVPVLLFRSM